MNGHSRNLQLLCRFRPRVALHDEAKDFAMGFWQASEQLLKMIDQFGGVGRARLSRDKIFEAVILTWRVLPIEVPFVSLMMPGLVVDLVERDLDK